MLPCQRGPTRIERPACWQAWDEGASKRCVPLTPPPNGDLTRDRNGGRRNGARESMDEAMGAPGMRFGWRSVVHTDSRGVHLATRLRQETSGSADRDSNGIPFPGRQSDRVFFESIVRSKMVSGSCRLKAGRLPSRLMNLIYRSHHDLVPYHVHSNRSCLYCRSTNHFMPTHKIPGQQLLSPLDHTWMGGLSSQVRACPGLGAADVAARAIMLPCRLVVVRPRK